MESSAAASSGQTLVLGCAREARHLLGASLEQLIARGLEVEVVSGVEAREDSLVITAARRPGAAYILFADGELDAARIDRVRARLIEAGVASTRIAVMPETWRGPLDILEQAQRMGLRVAPRRTTLVASVPELAPVGEGGITAARPANTGPHTAIDDDAEALAGIDRWGAFGRRPVRLAALVAIPIALLGTTFAIAAGRDPEPTPGLSPEEARARLAALVEPWRGGDEARAPAAPPAPEPASIAAVVATPAVPAPAPPIAAVTEVAAVVAPAAVPPPPPVRTDAAEIVVADDAPLPEIDEAEMQAIYAGLVARRFRALDILLVAPEPPRRKGKRVLKGTAKLSWSAAETYCEKLAIAGVDGWRLPRVGELSSLTSGAMLADGRFWSATEGDTFGASRVVWNSDLARMGSAPVKWKGGRVVCVRTLAKPPIEPEPARPR